MWDLIVSVPDHCLSFYSASLFVAYEKTRGFFHDVTRLVFD